MFRFAFLILALFAPLIAMQSFAASAGGLIEDSRRLSSGAGIVLVVGLQRG